MSLNPYEPPKVDPPPTPSWSFSFVARRLAIVLWVVSVVLLPVHLCVVSDISVRIGLAGIVTGLIAGITELCSFDDRQWRIALIGGGGICLAVLHPMLTH